MLASAIAAAVTVLVVVACSGGSDNATPTPGGAEVSSANGYGLESSRSALQAVTPPGDTTPPPIDSVLAFETSLQIVFGEPLDSDTATDIANYAIDNRIVASAASLAADQITVTLTTSAHTTGVSYTLTVTSVQDVAGNSMPLTSVGYVFLDATSPNFTVAFIADQGLGPDAEAVLNLIKAEGAQMVIHSGDFDYQADPDAWDAQIDRVLGPDFPYFASIGNNDNSAWSGYQAKLQQRLTGVKGAECSGDLGVQSACKYQGLFFLLTGPGEMGSGHQSYIRDQLAADQSLWSVCSWHKNQRDMQIGGLTDAVGWDVYEECREGGAIIATGHDHTYSRTRTLSDMENQVVDRQWPDGQDLRVAPGFTFAFVSGLGGRSVDAQDRCFPTTFPYGCDSGWASIYASDQGAEFGALFITFHVDGISEKARGVFKNVAGEIIDQFIVTANPPDTTAPVINPVLASETSLRIVFSEPLDSGTATDIGNYSINNGIAISAASLAADQISVTLTTSAHTTGVSYTVTITAVQDLAGNPMPATPVPYQFTSGLIAHWSFNEGFGFTANDSSGNGNTGTLVNGPAWVDGKVGKALDFSGSNNYVLIPHNDLIDFAANEDFSISFWFKDSTKSGNSNTSGHELIEKQDSGGVFYQIRSPSQNGSLRFQVDDGVDQDSFNSSVGDLADGLWHHVVLIRDYDTSIAAYVDGVLAGSDTTVSAGSIANSADLRLGLGNSGDYDGLLDEVRLYDRVLTPQEVADLFNAANDATPPSTPPGPATTSVSLLKVDVAWSASAVPESGISHHIVYRDNVDFGRSADMTILTSSRQGHHVITQNRHQFRVAAAPARAGDLINLPIS